MALHNDPATRKGRKKGKIALGVVLVLITALVGIGLWQRNNIEAVVQYSQYSQEELEQQLQDNDQQVEELLQAALEAARQVDAEASKDVEAETKTEPDTEGQTDVTAPVPSESEKTPESAPKAEQSTSEPAESKPQSQSQTPTAQQPTAGEKTPEPAQPEKPAQTTEGAYEQQLKAIVDKVYALRAHYLQALNDLQAEAVAAYKAIPKAERTRKAITSFVSTYISKATALEKTCDGQMDALVRELTALQKAYGQSMELVDTVKYTYANEKSLKKAWYMSQLEKKGLT